VIREAREDDLQAFQDIEAAAGEAFRSINMAAIADDAPPGVDELSAYQRDGRAWVVTDSGDRPVAYLLVDEVDQHAHIEQVTVHPLYARRGLGRDLIGEAATWAVAQGLEGLTLTTFESVPWNAPYYARLGGSTTALSPDAEAMEVSCAGNVRFPRTSSMLVTSRALGAACTAASSSGVMASAWCAGAITKVDAMQKIAMVEAIRCQVPLAVMNTPLCLAPPQWH